MHKFPARLDPFIGRDRELALIAGLIEQPACRLITLVGPGGIGKTRLAIQAAQGQAALFAGGVYFVPLGPLASAQFVVAAITSALEVNFPGAADPKHQLLSFLREKELMLVLDSVEHLLAEQQPEGSLAGLVGDILEQAPGVSLLVTSRERLHLTGEQLFVVRGLEMPLPGVIDRLEDYDAVQFFVECARRMDLAFTLTAGEAPSVVQICNRLAGMPLGIEMAAASVRVISCAEIAEEIEHNPDFLQAPSRDVPERHSSLRAVFDHAWRLLSEEERRVFANLSVFRGGFEREAAEEVAGATLPTLTALADKSVLHRTAAGRYDIHELLRQYALARLAAGGEEDAARGRHAHYYCSLAETTAPLLQTPEQRRWLDRLEADFGNFRAALAWSQTAAGEVEVGLRLGGALIGFWRVRGAVVEDRAWLVKGLALEGTVSEPVRARALVSAGWLAVYSADYMAAGPHFEAAMRISRKIGFTWGIAWALSGPGYIAWNRRDDDAAQALLAKSLGLFRELGDQYGIAVQLSFLGSVARARGDFKDAQAKYAESLAFFQRSGDLEMIADVNIGLGHLARAQGNNVEAVAFYDRSLALARELGDKGPIAEICLSLAHLARLQGDDDRAKTLLVEALVICRDFDVKLLIPYCLTEFGGLAAMQRQPDIGARLLSAAAALFAAIGKRMTVSMQADYDRDLAAACGQLDEPAFAAAWAEGQAMTQEQAIALALGT